MHRLLSAVWFAGLPALLLAACSSEGTGESPGSGGKANASQGGTVSGSGGSSSGGNNLASGGASQSTGGNAPAAGGHASGGTSNVGNGGANPNGGSNAGGSSNGTGGTKASGGTSSTGGAASGGTQGAGGTQTSGGSSGANSGGTKASGGSSATGGTSAGGSGGKATGGSAGNGTCTPPTPGSKGQNPLFSDQYTADPAPLVHNCTFYIGCGHDEGSTGFVMREWFLLSSSDMVHWTKTVALKLSDFKWANANAWAGQIVGPKNGKFYWYVPVNETASGGMAIGVAVADSPSGPWKDALGKALINDSLEMSNFNYSQASQTVYTIDPTVFIDDDGQAYLHYGGFGRMVEAKLNDDMISIDGKMQETTPQGFFEAAYLTKHNGTYYEIYAAGSNPATIDYATSTSPMGPWTRKGRILDALPGVPGQDAPTNHSGVAELGGQWYIVYHVSNGPNGGGTYKREVAVDKLTFNSDGTIAKVTPSSGLSF